MKTRDILLAASVHIRPPNSETTPTRSPSSVTTGPPEVPPVMPSLAYIKSDWRVDMTLPRLRRHPSTVVGEDVHGKGIEEREVGRTDPDGPGRCAEVVEGVILAWPQHRYVEHRFHGKNLDLEGGPLPRPKRLDVAITGRHAAVRAPLHRTKAPGCQGAVVATGISRR
jgi:hypothetical protein